MKKLFTPILSLIAFGFVQAQSPVVHYAFDGQVLTSTSSGSSLGHVSANPTYSTSTTSGNGSHSLSLGGAEYLYNTSFSTPSGLTGYTINYWVKASSKSGYNVHATQLKREKVSTADNYFGSFLTATSDTRKPYFEVYTSSTNADFLMANDTLDDNWHMLTYKWEPDTMAIYIDGVFNKGNSGPATFLSSNRALYVGALENDIDGVRGFQSSFEGLIDEIKIYQAGLSDGQIQSLYNTGGIVAGISNSSDLKVGIYPNPTRSLLNIRTSESIVKAEVLSILGDLIVTESGTIETVNVANLNQGVYLLKLTTTDGRSTVKKFTKE